MMEIKQEKDFPDSKLLNKERKVKDREKKEIRRAGTKYLNHKL